MKNTLLFFRLLFFFCGFFSLFLSLHYESLCLSLFFSFHPNLFDFPEFIPLTTYKKVPSFSKVKFSVSGATNKWLQGLLLKEVLSDVSQASFDERHQKHHCFSAEPSPGLRATFCYSAIYVHAYLLNNIFYYEVFVNPNRKS